MGSSRAKKGCLRCALEVADLPLPLVLVLTPPPPVPPPLPCAAGRMGRGQGSDGPGGSGRPGRRRRRHCAQRAAPGACHRHGPGLLRQPCGRHHGWVRAAPPPATPLPPSLPRRRPGPPAAIPITSRTGSFCCFGPPYLCAPLPLPPPWDAASCPPWVSALPPLPPSRPQPCLPYPPLTRPLRPAACPAGHRHAWMARALCVLRRGRCGAAACSKAVVAWPAPVRFRGLRQQGRVFKAQGMMIWRALSGAHGLTHTHTQH